MTSTMYAHPHQAQARVQQHIPMWVPVTSATMATQSPYPYAWPTTMMMQMASPQQQQQQQQQQHQQHIALQQMYQLQQQQLPQHTQMQQQALTMSPVSPQERLVPANADLASLSAAFQQQQQQQQNLDNTNALAKLAAVAVGELEPAAATSDCHDDSHESTSSDTRPRRTTKESSARYRQRKRQGFAKLKQSVQDLYAQCSNLIAELELRLSTDSSTSKTSSLLVAGIKSALGKIKATAIDRSVYTSKMFAQDLEREGISGLDSEQLFREQHRRRAQYYRNQKRQELQQWKKRHDEVEGLFNRLSALAKQHKKQQDDEEVA